uniref:Uncharacterized protein n=1 Tax=Triticum urartu TaxID=4572 RepID=A0A8R7R1T1_TRIUA
MVGLVLHASEMRAKMSSVASSDSPVWPRRSMPLPQLPARNGATHHILPNFIGGGPPTAPPPPGSRWRNSPVTPHGCTTLSHSPSLSF